MKAANEAQASAQIAQNNAAEAGAKASITSLHDIHSSISAQGGSSGYEQQGSSGYEQQGSSGYEQQGPSGQRQTKSSGQNSNIGQQSSPDHGGSEYEAASSYVRQTAPSPSKTKGSDQVAKQSSIKASSAKASSPVSAKSLETIASNHNYGTTEFKPSKQYHFAGY